MRWQKLTMVFSGAALLTLLMGGLASAASVPPFLATMVGGKPVVPLMMTGAFFILANAMLHLNPDRTKVSVASTGIVGIVAGLIFLGNVGVMMLTNYAGSPSPSNLGGFTNFVAGLGTMYGFFFLVVGLNQFLGLKHNVLGPIAILIGWMTLALGVVWLLNPGGAWLYHFTITLVWFIAMNLAGLYQVGKMSEKTLGYWLLLTAIYTFAIPGFLWALSPAMQGFI